MVKYPMSPESAEVMAQLIMDSYTMIPDRPLTGCRCGLCQFVRARQQAVLQMSRLPAQDKGGEK